MDSSFVSKARVVFHNAAAKAERVLTEIKADLKAEFGRPNSPLIQGSEEEGELPWICKTDLEDRHEEEIRRRVLEISKRPEEFFLKEVKDDPFIDMAVEMQSAGAILEHDEDLRNLRFQCVPKKMTEHEFWRRYFMRVNHVKQEVLRAAIKGSVETHSDTFEVKNDTFREYMELESPKKDPAEEAEYKKAFSVVAVPSSMLLRRLATAIRVGRSLKNMKELEMLGKSDKDSSQGADWSGLVPGLAAMKKLSLRDKDGRLRGSDGNFSCMWSLFDVDTQNKDTYISLDVSSQAAKSKIPEEIHGAPPGSFVAQLAEFMAGIKTEQKMAEFWSEVVSQLRHRWVEGQCIPRLPFNTSPDLRYCLLHQQLQVINCCIVRKKQHAAALASLDALSELQGFAEHSNIPDLGKLYTILSSQGDVGYDGRFPTRILFVNGQDGKLLLRLGADAPASSLRMLETGEPVYSPITQEGPILTENLIKETEELVLRTGSVGAGCSQLLSDMQAFKAANPGCILEDFVRWYSPLDWKQDPHSDSSTERLHADHIRGNQQGTRGYLSARMQCQGNLWQELWASAKPIPAAKQAPLYDEDLAGESTLNELNDLQPADLFEQLFIAVLGVGLTIAESAPVAKRAVVADQFKEYKDYIISTCSKGMNDEKLENLCQVYEAMETMLQSFLEEPQDSSALSAINFVGTETVPVSVEKSTKHYPHLIGIDRHLFRRPAREQNHLHLKAENPSGIFSRILEAKTSLFEKKSSKHAISEDCKRLNPQEGDWTFI